ncbi:resolvase [Paenibacillus sp. 32O-W]|nr:resolvase [Paenibacillus sp. 32O-W]
MNKSSAYIRVSSKEQNEARQLEAIEVLGINERDVFIDKQSGKDFNRPKYQAQKATLRRGDTLYIKELDRLGRNADEIKREWQEITQEIGAYIVVIDMPTLDTRPKDNGMGEMEVDFEYRFGIAFVHGAKGTRIHTD